MKIESNKINFVEFPTLLYKGNLKSVKHIVIHNSATGASAEANAKANYNATTKGQRSAFAHYYVDDEQVVRLARDTWKAYHTGKKEYNETTIGIEICVNPMGCLNECANNQCVSDCKRFKTMREKFYKAEDNAIDLIYTLLAKWNLTEDDVVFHSDLKATACPFFTKKLHKLSKAKDFLTIFNPKV